EELRDIGVKLPPGFVGNPMVAPRCPLYLAETGPFPTDRSSCPTESAVGIMTLDGYVDLHQPIFSVEPEVGYPAQFAFSTQGFTFVLYPELRSDGNYEIDVVSKNSPANGITGVE